MALLRDIRFGLRLLARNRSFAAAALAIVALGVGATTAVFSVVRGVLLEPLPYREPNRVMLFRADLPGYAHQPSLTSEEMVALRDRTDLFESVAVINESEGNLTSPDDMEAVTAASVSDDFLQTLGVAPLLGRSVSTRDIGKQWVGAVDISYELWQRRWHGDAAILGKPIEVNNLSVRVVGVLPRGFRLYLGPGVDIASRIDVLFPRVSGYDRDPFRGQVVIARLRHNVTRDAAQAAVDVLVHAFVASHPSSYPTGAVRISLSSLDREVVSDVEPALLALAGAVVFVLLVACANLTNLLLARAAGRTRELAVRAAIGASRVQIVRQLVAEGLVIGGIGACGGLLLAQWGVEALVALAPATLPRREAIAFDASVAAFAIVVSLVCALLVSLVQAWHATSAGVAGMLKQDPASSPRAAATRGLLVAGQLALSLVLLAGAGLMTRAFIAMRSVPLGFEPRSTMTMNVHLQIQRFNMGTLAEARARRLSFYHDLVDRVRQLPGVNQAGLGLPIPLGGVPITQRVSRGPGDPERPVDMAIALAGYLETLRVPLLAGRYFAIGDDDQPVAIVEQRLANDLWPHQSALGRPLFFPGIRAQWARVIGVVPHVQARSLRGPGIAQVWVTYATLAYSDLNLVVRASNAMALVPAVQSTVQKLGPGRPVHDIAAIDDYVADASSDTRFALFVLGGFAGLAVVLAAIGVYGVVSFATARRTREIAVRLALGANFARIMTLVARQGAAWTAAGLVAGIAAARVLARYLETLLFQVRENDAVTYISVATLLGLVALVAIAVPTLRAARIDPMQALRSE